MAQAKTIMAVIIAVTIAATLFAPVANAVTDNSGSVSITNETVTAQYGQYVDLEGYDIDDGSETVWMQEGDGSYTQGTETTDYEMANANGSVQALSGSSTIDDGETIKVSYTYQATSSQAETVLVIIPLMMGVLMLGVMAGKIMGMM